MQPLHTSEALAPLFVALAHIQVALVPISIYGICGPCTWPFIIKPKQLALKKTFLTPKKYFPNLFKIFFTFVFFIANPTM
jgi:hypothetical protein